MARVIRGVALVVECLEGEILMLQEFESKPHFGKFPGMYSIPMETSNPGEPDRTTLKRLVREELPGLDGDIRIGKRRLGSYQIVPHVWVRLYWASVSNRNLPTSRGGEVGNYRWESPLAVRKLWLRQGAREMLEDFVHGRVGVVRRICQPPPIKE